MEVDRNRFDKVVQQGLGFVLQLALILGGMGFASVFAGTLSANPLFDGWYADPQIRRFGDRYWIFPTYSQDFREQTFMDVFSSKDLRTWTKHPQSLTTNEVKWAKDAMWAPDAQEKDGIRRCITAANPMIGVTEHPTEDGRIIAVAVNYSSSPQECEFGLKGRVGAVWRGRMEADKMLIPANDAVVFEIVE